MSDRGERLGLRRIIAELAALYPAAPEPVSTDPFVLVLWENVAYLADDEDRRSAFDVLRHTVGLTPADVLGADSARLAAVGAHGILPEASVGKLRAAAEIALDAFDGDVSRVLTLPVAEAKRALRRFPGIGEPGAEKILLYTRTVPFLAPESNGLRVLVRLGLCQEQRSYAATYAAARAMAATELGDDFDLLYAARHYLRIHGKTLCRRRAPLCEQCVVRVDCAFGRRSTRNPRSERN